MHTVGLRKVLLPKESPRSSLLWFLSPIKKNMPPSEWATFQYCTQTLWHRASSFVPPFLHSFMPQTFNERPICTGASLVVQTVKNPPTTQETQVRSLSQEHPLEKGIAPHSSFLAWKIPWTEESGGLRFMRLQRVDTTEQPSLSLSNMCQGLWSILEVI